MLIKYQYRMIQLLVKILETSNTHFDSEAISAAWRKFRSPQSPLPPMITLSPKPVYEYQSTPVLPNANVVPATDREFRPSARAIRERLVRIRQNVRAQEEGHHFSIGGSARPPKSTLNKPDSTENSAAKPKAGAKRTPKSDHSSPVKYEGLHSEPETPTPITKRRRVRDLTDGANGYIFGVDAEGGDVKTPAAKRTKSQSTAWLSGEDWDTVKKSPQGKILFAHDEHEEDMNAKKNYGGLDGIGDVKYDVKGKV